MRASRLVVTMPAFSGEALHAALHAYARAVWQAAGSYRLLNLMLLRAAEPAQRFRIFQRFYGLDGRLIGRFYASRSTLADKARILTGRPPAPVGRAIAALMRG